MSLTKRAIAELIGTFWLVFGGCGAAVLSASFPDGIGLLGIALAFGLTVLTMTFAIGPLSGAHLNPAVSIGLVVGGRFNPKDLPAYIFAQVAGGILAAMLLYLIVNNGLHFDRAISMAVNGYGEHSPRFYSMMAGLIMEVVMTAMFLLVIMGVTARRAVPGFAPIAIGLTLTLIQLISMPVTNTSVNPARSTGPALIAGGWALSQLWLFWVAPILGAVIGGALYRWLAEESK